MRIDERTPIWVVTDATPVSTLPDVCHKTTLGGLILQVKGGLDLDQHPVVFTDEQDAHDEAGNRLLVQRAAAWIRKQRGAPADEVVRITLHGRDGKVLYEGDVQ